MSTSPLMIDSVSPEQQNTLAENSAYVLDEIMQRQAFETVLSDALRTTALRPEQSTLQERGMDDLTNPFAGKVGEARLEVDPQSHELQSQQEAGQTETDMLIDRVNTLYFDLTNYQVAWKVAQRVQQDMSQLLRG